MADEKKKSRELLFMDKVTLESVRGVLKQVRELMQDDPAKQIVLYITSGGGNPHAGLAFYDAIRLERVPLVTVGLGYVASAAIPIFLAGADRWATPHTLFLIHNIKRCWENESLDLENVASEAHGLTVLQATTDSLIAKEVGKKIEEVVKIRQQAHSFTAEEAKTFGLVHMVLK